MPPHRPLPKTADFPALEEQVLQRWRDRDIFRESIRRRQGAEEFVFYEGPPTANGRPGSHHVLARVFKDIFPRFKTMRGHYVHRKGGPAVVPFDGGVFTSSMEMVRPDREA